MPWSTLLTALLHTVFFVSLAGGAALVAIWAGLSRRHRLLRLAVFCVLPAAMYFADAPELVVWISLEMVAITGSLIVFQLLAHAPWGRTAAGLPRIRFGFRDVFFVIFLVAFAVWSSMLVRKQQFLEFDPSYTLAIGAYLVDALGLAAVTLAAAWTALGRRRLGVRLFVLIATVGLVTAVWYWVGDTMASLPVLWSLGASRCLLPGVLAAVVAVYLVAVRGWAASAPKEATPAGAVDEPTTARTKNVWRRRCSLVVLVALTSLMAVPGSDLYYELVRPVSLPADMPPSPNGYTQLVAIAKQIDESALWATGSPTPAQWQAFEKRHRLLLVQARQAIDLPSQVPLGPPWNQNVSSFQALRSLARSLDAQAGLPFMQGKGDEASAIYFDLLRLADRTGRGGVLVDCLVAWAFEGMGIAGMTKVVPDLTPQRSRELIEHLYAFAEAREPLCHVFEREDAYAHLAYGWAGRWYCALDDLLPEPSQYFLRPNHPLIVQGEKRQRAAMSVLLADLAIHVYRHDHGRPPNELTDLVGEYLRSVPIDAFDGQPVRYRKSKTQYLLYSIGVNQRDDAGNANVETGDWPVVKRPLGTKKAGGGP